MQYNRFLVNLKIAKIILNFTINVLKYIYKKYGGCGYAGGKEENICQL